MLPNLHPLGSPHMINHVQRGQRWVNESGVIGCRVLVVDTQRREIHANACVKRDLRISIRNCCHWPDLQSSYGEQRYGGFWLLPQRRGLTCFQHRPAWLLLTNSAGWEDLYKFLSLISDKHIKELFYLLSSCLYSPVCANVHISWGFSSEFHRWSWN